MRYVVWIRVHEYHFKERPPSPTPGEDVSKVKKHLQGLRCLGLLSDMCPSIRRNIKISHQGIASDTAFPICDSAEKQTSDYSPSNRSNGLRGPLICTSPTKWEAVSSTALIHRFALPTLANQAFSQMAIVSGLSSIVKNHQWCSGGSGNVPLSSAMNASPSRATRSHGTIWWPRVDIRCSSSIGQVQSAESVISTDCLRSNAVCNDSGVYGSQCGDRLCSIQRNNVTSNAIHNIPTKNEWTRNRGFTMVLKDAFMSWNRTKKFSE